MVFLYNELFFYKQKTSSDLRICVWSSDVCSSDLEGVFIAAQGGTEVRADTISARYREAPSGGNRIYRLEATGSVRVACGDHRLFGPTVVYDPDDLLFPTTGGESPLSTHEDTTVDQGRVEIRNTATPTPAQTTKVPREEH